MVKLKLKFDEHQNTYQCLPVFALQSVIVLIDDSLLHFFLFLLII